MKTTFNLKLVVELDEDCIKDMSTIQIATDGCCLCNPGTGGWAVVFRYDKFVKVLYGYQPDTTNNRMELTAAIKALEHLQWNCNIELTADSKYVIEGITLWINSWKKKDWKDVKNVDLWKRLEHATLRHTIRWIWTKGHATHTDNCLADEYAMKAAKMKSSGIYDLTKFR